MRFDFWNIYYIGPGVNIINGRSLQESLPLIIERLLRDNRGVVAPAEDVVVRTIADNGQVVTDRRCGQGD